MSLKKFYDNFKPSYLFYFLAIVGFILELFEINTNLPVPWYLYGFLGWAFQKTGH